MSNPLNNVSRLNHEPSKPLSWIQTDFGISILYFIYPYKSEKIRDLNRKRTSKPF